MSPDDPEHLSARWIVAPLVSSIAAVIARERRCGVTELGTALMYDIESACLDWYAAYLQPPAAELTPTRDLWSDSQRPTVPGPPPLPQGVARKR